MVTKRLHPENAWFDGVWRFLQALSNGPEYLDVWKVQAVVFAWTSEVELSMGRRGTREKVRRIEVVIINFFSFFFSRPSCIICIIFVVRSFEYRTVQATILVVVRYLRGNT